MSTTLNLLLTQQIVDKLKRHHYQISFAESCTGGLLVSTLVSISGASQVLAESYVTYSEDAKCKILNVSKKTLEQFSVYSAEVALEMAEGLKKITNADVCISITGEAESSKNVCECYYTIIVLNQKINEKASFTGTRNEVRIKQVNHLFSRLNDLLD